MSNHVSVLLRGQIQTLSHEQFLQEFPRTEASGTITIGGSVTTGDKVVAEVVIDGKRVQAVATAGGGDSTSVLAQKLADAINAQTDMNNVGINATAASAVVTIKFPGALGKQQTLRGWSIGATTTVTIAGTGTADDKIGIRVTNVNLPGGFADVSITVTDSQTATQRATALKNAINAEPNLKALGITATNSSGVITFVIPTSAGETTLQEYAWDDPDQTITVSGTPNATEIVSFTITNAKLPSGAVTVSYTVQESDTNTLIATGLKNAINNSAALAEKGITATSSSAVVSVSTPFALGPRTYSRVNSAGSTLTLANGSAGTVAESEATETTTEAAFTGGGGPVIPKKDFSFFHNGQTFYFKQYEPKVVGDQLAAELLKANAPIH